MKHTNDLERSLENLQLKTTAETDQRILGDALAALAQSTRNSLRSTIMKKHWPKLAAAAVIIVAIMGSWLFQASPDMASSAYAELLQAVDNSKATEWVHFRTIQAGEEVEGWISIQPYRQFIRRSNTIECIDAQTAQRFEYNVSSRTLMVKLIPELRSERVLALLKKSSFFEVSLAGIEQIKEDQGLKVTRTQQEIDGKTYTVLHLTSETNEHMSGQIRIDPELSRIVSITIPGSVSREPMTIDLDYPTSGPEDIYALGVPRDAKIIDPDNSGQREESEWDRKFKKAIEAIDSRPDWPSTPEEVSKLYWEARAVKNYDEMAVLWPASAFWNQRLKDEKPVSYVFGKAYEDPQAPEYTHVPYAAEGYYRQHNRYNLKMILTNKGSAKGRYYIVSGN